MQKSAHTTKNPFPFAIEKLVEEAITKWYRSSQIMPVICLHFRLCWIHEQKVFVCVSESHKNRWYDNSLCQSFPFHYVQTNNFHFSMDLRKVEIERHTHTERESEEKMALELSWCMKWTYLPYVLASLILCNLIYCERCKRKKRIESSNKSSPCTSYEIIKFEIIKQKVFTFTPCTVVDSIDAYKHVIDTIIR